MAQNLKIWVKTLSRKGEKRKQDIRVNANQEQTTEIVPTFRKKIGKTTYIVGVHFSKTSKETIKDKLERLILRDLENERYL